MTKEEAIARIKEHKIVHKMNEPRAIHISEALDMAIKALQAEHCEDAISREDVIKAIDRHTFNTDDGLCLDEDITIILEEVPPVIPTQKWIPVSERLPKPYTFVNVTCRSLVDDRENWVVETIYSPIPKEANEQGFSDWGNIPILNWGKAEVIAWMQRDIPEPYQAEMESKEWS